MYKVEIKIDVAPLEGLKQSLVNKILKKAITVASRVVRDKLQGNAEEIARLGYLAKSIGIKIRIYKGAAVAIVGPRSKWKRDNGTYTKGKNKGKPRTIKPSYYMHLVEKGSKRSKANPIEQQALSSTEEQFYTALSDAIRQGISDQLNKK